MAAYSFNSEPRVVSTRSEKYAPGDKMSMNLMHDKRVFRGHIHDLHNIRPVLSPQEQEELHLQKEKTKRQEEMMKKQLEAFKKNKTKQSPYDIRPAATGRIEVDLQYFLTDQKDVKPDQSEISTQANEILSKKQDPPYVPKKTGRDVSTQIEDGDLFSFNQEVQPILNVLSTKILEQALLEVEEEYELSKMSEYKTEFNKKRTEEDKIWANMVQEEIENIKRKNEELKNAMTKYVKTQKIVKKFQNLNLAKQFLSGLVPKLLDDVAESILQADNFENLLLNEYFPLVLEGTEHYLKEKNSHKSNLKAISKESEEEMRVSRKKIIQQHKQKAQKEQTRNINYSKSKRLVRLLYKNPEFYILSEFQARIGPALRGEEYVEPASDQLLMKDAEKKEGNDSVIVEEIKQVRPDWASNGSFYVDDIKRLSFLVANHPIQDTPRDSRKYGVSAMFFSENGELLYSVDSLNGNSVTGTKFVSNCRDMTKKTSYDEMIVISLNSVPSEVQSVVLFVFSARTVPGESGYANYALMDFTTSQKIDSQKIKLDEFQADENGNTLPLYFAYRIFRKEPNPRTLKVFMHEGNALVDLEKEDNHWVLDIYNSPISKTYQEGSELVRQVIVDGFRYSQRLTDGLIEYRKRKLLEDIEYKKSLEESEQSASKKKKKRPAKGKNVEEPIKMTEYVPPVFTFPSRTFGPVFIDTEIDKLEVVYDKVAREIDPGLKEMWELGFNVMTKNRVIKKVHWVLKAHTLKDLRVEEKKVEAVAVPNQEEENLDS